MMMITPTTGGRVETGDMGTVIPEISDDEKAKHKGKKKMLLTGGLATVATIHAAHSLYQGMEKREARRKLLKEGEISPEQAKRDKNKARLQDAASIGLAALGIKGAYSEWKETKEAQAEIREEKEKRARHAQKREARRRKMAMLAAQNYVGTNYTGSMPNLAPYPHDPYRPPPPAYNIRTGNAIHYADDNPYGATESPAYMTTPPPPPPAATGYPPPPIGDPRYDMR